MLQHLLQFDEKITLALNGSDSLFWDGVAKTATSTVTWIPLAAVLLYVVIHNNNVKKVWLILLAMAVCVLIADQTASGIFKPMVERFRPAQDPYLMYQIDIVDGYRGGKYGFFSSHASNTFALATFVSLLIRHSALVWAVYSWALLNCWTRVYLGVHYFGELLVGSIFGAIVGFVVYWAFCRIGHVEIDTTHRPEIQTATGYKRMDIYVFVSALWITYFYILLRAVIV